MCSNAERASRLPTLMPTQLATLCERIALTDPALAHALAREVLALSARRLLVEEADRMAARQADRDDRHLKSDDRQRGLLSYFLVIALNYLVAVHLVSSGFDAYEIALVVMACTLAHLALLGSDTANAAMHLVGRGLAKPFRAAIEQVKRLRDPNDVTPPEGPDVRG